MKIAEFARVSDSNKKLEDRRAQVDGQRASKKVADAKANLASKIRDTENDQELIDVMVAAAEDLPVSDVLTTVVEVLSPIVEKLNTSVADARRAVAAMRKKMKDSTPARKPKVSDTAKKRLISRMKDDETTIDDMKSEAAELLETFDPASVVEVIIEALPSVIEAVVAASSTNE